MGFGPAQGAGPGVALPFAGVFRPGGGAAWGHVAESQRGGWFPQTASALKGDGMFVEAVTAQDVASAQEADVDGISLRQDSDALSGTEVHASIAASYFALGAVGSYTRIKFGVTPTEGVVRAFVGWTSGSATVTVSADDPVGLDMFGLQLRAADTFWQFMAADAGAFSRQATAAPAPVARSVYNLELFNPTASSLRLVLRDGAGLLISDHTFSAGLPGAADFVRPIAGFELTGVPSAARSMWQYLFLYRSGM